jgi:DNA-binding NarL/FixJ family response regulator
VKSEIRVILMDDQSLILEAIAALLRVHGVEHGITVVACAKNYHQVLEAVQQQRPHLLLLDMHMPEINGSEVAYKLKKHTPDLKVVMLSSFESLQEVAQAKAAGADGYAFKSDPTVVLVNTILEVMAGQNPFVSTVSPAELLPAALDYGLTRRQRQVLKLLAQGEHNKAIAQCLGISVRTAEKHRAQVLAKLNKPSPVTLSHVAVELGLTHD